MDAVRAKTLEHIKSGKLRKILVSATACIVLILSFLLGLSLGKPSQTAGDSDKMAGKDTGTNSNTAKTTFGTPVTDTPEVGGTVYPTSPTGTVYPTPTPSVTETVPTQFKKIASLAELPQDFGVTLSVPKSFPYMAYDELSATLVLQMSESQSSDIVVRVKNETLANKKGNSLNLVSDISQTSGIAYEIKPRQIKLNNTISFLPVYFFGDGVGSEECPHSFSGGGEYAGTFVTKKNSNSYSVLVGYSTETYCKTAPLNHLEMISPKKSALPAMEAAFKMLEGAKFSD